MAQRNNMRNIQIPNEVVLKLLKKGVEKGFKTFKAFAEHILTVYAESTEK